MVAPASSKSVRIFDSGVSGTKAMTNTASLWVPIPTERVIDHVLTPMPLNPLCWDVLLLATHGDRYTIRHGTLATAALNNPTLSDLFFAFGASGGNLQCLAKAGTQGMPLTGVDATPLTGNHVGFRVRVATGAFDYLVVYTF